MRVIGELLSDIEKEKLYTKPINFDIKELIKHIKDNDNKDFANQVSKMLKEF